MTDRTIGANGYASLSCRYLAAGTLDAGKAGSADSAAYRNSMRSLASGVMIVASRNRDDSSGMTMTAMVSLSDNPPLFGIAVNKQASVHDLIKGSGLLSVNVLAQCHAGIADVFSGKLGIGGAQRFAFGSWSTHETGLRVLDDAASVLIGKVSAEIDCGTHSFFIVAATECFVQPGGKPLLYHDRQFGSLSDSLVEQGA